MATVSHSSEPETGFIGALRRLRDPLLLFVVPVTFALLLAFVGYRASWPIGFDFRGTSGSLLARYSTAQIFPSPRSRGRRRQPRGLPAGLHAVRSVSLASVAGALGGSVSTAVAASFVVGLLLLGLAAWLATRIDGEPRSFAIVVAAGIVATPRRLAELCGVSPGADRGHLAEVRGRPCRESICHAADVHWRVTGHSARQSRDCCHGPDLPTLEHPYPTASVRSEAHSGRIREGVSKRVSEERI